MLSHIHCIINPIEWFVLSVGLCFAFFLDSLLFLLFMYSVSQLSVNFLFRFGWMVPYDLSLVGLTRDQLMDFVCFKDSVLVLLLIPHFYLISEVI